MSATKSDMDGIGLGGVSGGFIAHPPPAPSTDPNGMGRKGSSQPPLSLGALDMVWPMSSASPYGGVTTGGHHVGTTPMGSPFSPQFVMSELDHAVTLTSLAGATPGGHKNVSTLGPKSSWSECMSPTG